METKVCQTTSHSVPSVLSCYLLYITSLILQLNYSSCSQNIFKLGNIYCALNNFPLVGVYTYTDT